VKELGDESSSKSVNMLITISNNKEEHKFNFLDNVYVRLSKHFQNEVNTSQPLHLKTINAFLGRIYHFDKQTIKLLVNDLSRKDLVEIKKGSGNANYFVVLRKVAK
jgi:hypothetical protein